MTSALTIFCLVFFGVPVAATLGWLFIGFWRVAIIEPIIRLFR